MTRKQALEDLFLAVKKSVLRSKNIGRGVRPRS